jgi:hypothetical protein
VTAEASWYAEFHFATGSQDLSSSIVDEHIDADWLSSRFHGSFCV